MLIRSDKIVQKNDLPNSGKMDNWQDNPQALVLKGKNVQARFDFTKSKLKSLFPDPSMGEVVLLTSYVSWSFHDLIDYLIDITGPATCYLTSWAVSENPARLLLHLLNSGKALELNCLFDQRIKSQCPQAFQIIERNLTRIGLVNIHAKSFVAINENWAVSVTSTANLTNKKRIEKYVVCFDFKAAEMDAAWIMDCINNANEYA
jgi:hypothetical protein